MVIKRSSKKVKSNSVHVAKVRPLAVGFFKRSFFLLAKRPRGSGEELCLIKSKDGEDFSSSAEIAHIVLPQKIKEDIRECGNFKVFCHGGDVVLTYNRHTADKTILVYAVTHDLLTWIVTGEIPNIKDEAIMVPELKKGSGHTVYSVSNDRLRLDVSTDLETWTHHESPRAPHWHFFEGASFNLIGAFPVSGRIVVLFESKVVVDVLHDTQLNDSKIGEVKYVKIGAALFMENTPAQLDFTTELPFIELPFERHGVEFLGVIPITRKKAKILRLYAVSERGKVIFFELEEDVLLHLYERPHVNLKRQPENPILKPTDNYWEQGGSFNPAALELGGKVHLLYRAVGSDGFSYIGYAASEDGKNFTERSSRPVYVPRERFEGGRGIDPDNIDGGLFASGSSWGGCEDPKVTLIGDRVYMTYVAHAGYWPTRTALTSISVEDFLNKNWKWSKPMLMSPPNVGSKSVVIHPEQVNGKFLIFHRTWPNIVIDMVPNLEFGEGKQWLKGQYRILPRRSFWDSRKLSMGAAPIKTKHGWLAIYNAVDRHDGSKYKMGAMLLRLEDPREVISRLRKPLLSPDAWYENDGKPGIVYPGGAIERDGILHVYYGGGDKVSCVGTIPTEELVDNLLKDGEPKLDIKTVSF